MTLSQRLRYYAGRLARLPWSARVALSHGRPWATLLGRLTGAAPRTVFLFKDGGYFDAFGAEEAYLDLWRMFGPRYEYLPLAEVGRSSVYVDIGAHYGEFCVFVAKFNPQARVLAFEPSRSNFERLTANIAQAGAGNVEAHHLALAARSGERVLVVDDEDTAKRHTVPSATEGQVENACQTISLDDLFDRHGLTEVDFLKIDCEGCEYPVFLSEPRALAKIRRLGMEYHAADQPEFKELVALLGRRGACRVRPFPNVPQCGNLIYERR